MKNSYEVIYTRDAESDWWIAEIPEVPGTLTQGRTIDQSRRRIREALEAMLDADVSAVTLVDKVKLPAKVLKTVIKAKNATVKAIELREEASMSMQEAAFALVVEGGLSLRDAGELIGVKRQRVDQLLKERTIKDPANHFRILEARAKSSA